jgi:hypothetical protein
MLKNVTNAETESQDVKKGVFNDKVNSSELVISNDFEAGLSFDDKFAEALESSSGERLPLLRICQNAAELKEGDDLGIGDIYIRSGEDIQETYKKGTGVNFVLLDLEKVPTAYTNGRYLKSITKEEFDLAVSKGWPYKAVIKDGDKEIVAEVQERIVWTVGVLDEKGQPFVKAHLSFKSGAKKAAEAFLKVLAKEAKERNVKPFEVVANLKSKLEKKDNFTWYGPLLTLAGK